MKNLLFLFIVSLMIACGPIHTRTHHTKIKDQKVKCYKIHNTTDDSWLWWYVIMCNNNCYYYSSPTAITNYSSVTWQTSTVNPVSNVDAKEVQEMPEQEVAAQDLSPEMQADMNSNPDNFGGMTEDEMGDYEGGTESAGSDNSSDGGSSDGGSDSGGGDGGGDGGGGGD